MKISLWNMKIQNFLMWFKNGLKAQKLLAQGSTLGIIAFSARRPVRGKSFTNRLFLKLLPLQGDRFATIKNPGRCPGLGASALFRAYGENLSELELYITLG